MGIRQSDVADGQQEQEKGNRQKRGGKVNKREEKESRPAKR